jgi:GNAT superfamily N-acetyltransferase
MPTSLSFREITASDVPELFVVRPKTRENAMTVEELARLGIDPRSVTESLADSTKGWLCEDGGQVVGFAMADRATAEFLVIAVLPEYEGRGVGGRLMELVSRWLLACGCTRAWLTTDLDTSLRAYGFYRRYGWTDWKVERGLRYMELFQSGVSTSPADAMLGGAIAQTLEALPGERSAVFARLVGEIERYMAAHPAERPWTCRTYAGTDGSAIFRGGVGHSLVIDPAGRLWRARSYEDFETTYRLGDGSGEIETLTPLYAQMREYLPRANA